MDLVVILFKLRNEGVLKSDGFSDSGENYQIFLYKY